ncbi:membrane protein [Acrocarpospora pleiomorpha]|uniref:Membrane protein n=1 Tax=Acrocarpospora pleiomorpha TaxID=90975 RepID=A0A5M3XY94_9ACTN|nr:type II secretion system F family protein [Acrocarpospora pleiomorpha]GES24433.1 membrane protein [Acrocarpospora pleiomorpha]
MLILMGAGLAALSVWIWPTRKGSLDRLLEVQKRSRTEGVTAHSGHPMGSAQAHPLGAGQADPLGAGPLQPSSGGTRSAEAEHAARQLQKGILVAGPIAVLTYLVVGGLPGLIAAAMAATAAIALVRRKEPANSRRRRERMITDLPFAADLMVACLRAGQPLTAAAETAARAVNGPLGECLFWVSAQMRLGADPATAWSALAEERPLASLARTMSRAVDSGAPVADVLTRLANDARYTTRSASSAAARRVGVQAVAPLGLCFLPAFVFLGIIPVVAGLAAQVLTP